jgi:hypothetical protein
MKIKNIKLLLPLIITLIILTIVKIIEPEEINWSISFAAKDKIPYGGYIINDLSHELFPGEDVKLKEFPVYNILKNNYYINTNYVFINGHFALDKLDTEYLLRYVAEGNNVFISAFDIYGDLADSLNITTYVDSFNEDSVTINFIIPELKTDSGYHYIRGNFNYYFEEFDTSMVQVLGENGEGNVNFIRIKYGGGNFFLHTLPFAFTNYHLLNSENNEYVYKVLSHLPVQETFWDDYYKDGNRYTASSLNYIISQKSLRWAYYIILASAVFFIFFYGRRRQRIIPVIPPLKNSTIEFVETIGNLYYQQKDYKNIAEKKITYLLDYIRNRYLIKTSNFDEETIKKISEKSLMAEGKIKSIFRNIEKIKSSAQISEDDLLNFNYQIEKFYERTK